MDAADLLVFLESAKIHAFRRNAYGPGEAPFHYKDLTPPGHALYEPLWPYEYRTMAASDLKTLYFCISEVEKLSTGPKSKKATKTEAAYKKLGAAIDYELKNTPDLPPDNSKELIDMIFECTPIRKIINRDIQSKSDRYIKRRLSKLGLLDERLKGPYGAPTKK